MAIIKLWITMPPLYRNYKLFLRLPLFILLFCCWYNVLFSTMWENRRVMISQKINYMKMENSEELNALFLKTLPLVITFSKALYISKRTVYCLYLLFLEMIIKYYLYTNLRYGVVHKFKIRYRLYAITAAFMDHSLK